MAWRAGSCCARPTCRWGMWRSSWRRRRGVPGCPVGRRWGRERRGIDGGLSDAGGGPGGDAYFWDAVALATGADEPGGGPADAALRAAVRGDRGPDDSGSSAGLLPAGADRARVRVDGGGRGVRRGRWARGVSGEPAHGARGGRGVEGGGGVAADPLGADGGAVPGESGGVGGLGRLRGHGGHGGAAGGALRLRGAGGGGGVTGGGVGVCRGTGRRRAKPTPRAELCRWARGSIAYGG